MVGKRCAILYTPHSRGPITSCGDLRSRRRIRQRHVHSKGDEALSVRSKAGREAVVAMLGPGEFFGEGSLAGQTAPNGQRDRSDAKREPRAQEGKDDSAGSALPEPSEAESTCGLRVQQVCEQLRRVARA